jgi:centromere/kinetochore protein ZW10
LVDITYLLETGALVDFTQAELVHIIVALFSDSPKRAAIIEKIWNLSGDEVA